jgi:hypothetical protein
MARRRIMRAFKISEISGCDQPAQVHARVAIIKRDASGDEVGKAERPMSDDELAAFDAHGEGPVHDKLRANYDNQLRSFPNLSPERAFGNAFRSLSFKERDELRAEESGEAQARAAEDAARLRAVLQGVDVGKVDIGALVDIVLHGTTEELRKADPTLTRERAYVAARAAKPWLLKIQHDARRRQLAASTGDEVRTAALTKRDAAFGALQAHAEELRKSNPELTIEMARVEARRIDPALARVERDASRALCE